MVGNGDKNKLMKEADDGIANIQNEADGGKAHKIVMSKICIS